MDGFQSEPNEYFEVDKRFIGDQINYPFEQAKSRNYPWRRRRMPRLARLGAGST
jgi:hypothetical protein